MALYHKFLGFPENTNLPNGFINLKYSKHATFAAMTDRYGHINLPSDISIKESNIIEIEIVKSNIIKYVYRTKYNKEYDLILVIMPGNNLVKTVWLNSVYDKHKTLNEAKYVRP